MREMKKLIKKIQFAFQMKFMEIAVKMHLKENPNSIIFAYPLLVSLKLNKEYYWSKFYNQNRSVKSIIQRDMNIKEARVKRIFARIGKTIDPAICERFFKVEEERRIENQKRRNEDEIRFLFPEAYEQMMKEERMKNESKS